MKISPQSVSAVILLMFLVVPIVAQERSISRADLIEKTSGFWIGQLVGNSPLGLDASIVSDPLSL